MQKTGGGCTHFLGLARGLQDLGLTLKILIPGYRPYSGKFYGLPVYRVPTLKKGNAGYLLFELLCIPFFAVTCIFFRPDVIYGRVALIHCVPLMLARILGIPYVLEQNGIAEEEYELRGFPKFLTKLLVYINKINLRFTTKIRVVTPGIKAGLVSRYGVPSEKCFIISNGTDTSLFRPIPIEKARQRVSFDKDLFYIGFVGSFAPWQGLEKLLEAFSLVRQTYDTYIKIVLVGDGEEEVRLRQLVIEKQLDNVIEFRGRVDHELIPYYINAFDLCYIQKQGLSFGFSPLKLYEYMACGKSILAGAVRGIKEPVEQAGCGYTFNPDDIGSLADNIIKAYKERTSLEVIGRRGRHLCNTNYNWKGLAEKLIHIFVYLQKKEIN